MSQELSLEEANEIEFSVAIEGTDTIDDRPEVRLVCEHADMAYVFKGDWTVDGDVNVIIPPMKGIIKEGLYNAHVEVIMEGRIFKPLDLALKFKAPLRVMAEVKMKEPTKKSTRRVEPDGPVVKVTEVKKHKPKHTAKPNKKLDKASEFTRLLEEL